MRKFSDWLFIPLLWCLSLPIVLLSIGFLRKWEESFPPQTVLEASLAVSSLCGCLAWLLLLAMSVAYLIDVRLPNVLAMAGHICGVIGLAPFLYSSYGLVLLLVAPGILLVIVVTPYHMRTEPPSLSAAKELQL